MSFRTISLSSIFVLATFLIAFKLAAAPLDLAKLVHSAVKQGASAEQIIEMLEDHGVTVSDATVIAIHNAPQEMAGELTNAAMAKVPSNQQEEIGYLALSASSGIGSCKVAQAIGITPPSICAELVRETRPVSRAPTVGMGSGGGQSASPGAI
jgi:hypothetical protein